MIPLLQDLKSSTILISIRSGPLSLYCTTSKTPVLKDGNLYLSEPTVRVDLPSQVGLPTEEESAKVFFPLQPESAVGAWVLSTFGEPRAAAPTTISVVNSITAGPDLIQDVHLYKGVVVSSSARPSERPNSIKLEIRPEWLVRLNDITVGMRADASCGHAFGGPGCWHSDSKTLLTPSDYSTTPGFATKVRVIKVVVDPAGSLVSRKIQLGIDSLQHPGCSLATLTARGEGWWKRSYLEKDGLRLLIADWLWNSTLHTGTNLFILNQTPPASWLAGNVPATLYPGCLKTPEACASRNRSVFFGGYGYGIPAYNPVMEQQ